MEGRAKWFAQAIISKLMPLKKDRYVFTSFEGHYNDNPRYISETMQRIAPEKEIVWLVSRDRLALLPDGVRGVEYGTLKAAVMRGSATALVDNVYGERSCWMYSEQLTMKQKLICFLVKKQGQRLYTTFHATPLKHLGRDQIGNRFCGLICPETTMMLGNQFTVDIMDHVTFGAVHTVLLGSPRNDPLFLDDAEKAKLRGMLGLPMERKVILYAPTFRNDGRDTEGKNVRRSGIEQLESMDPERLFGALSSRFGGEWIMVCRFHYHVESMVNWDDLEKRYPGRFINGNRFDDMAGYLTCADVLVTDASSSMFDFALTGRPCFLYFPDYEHYRDEERGFYTDPEQLPFPLCRNFDTLTKAITDFDGDRYAKEVGEMLDRFGNVDHGRSAEAAVEYILAGKV